MSEEGGRMEEGGGRMEKGIGRREGGGSILNKLHNIDYTLFGIVSLIL